LLRLLENPRAAGYEIALAFATAEDLGTGITALTFSGLP